MTLAPQDGETIAVWFSCGAPSAAAAYYTLRDYGERCAVRIINTPVEEEHPDNRRFLADVQEWLGREIEIATNPDFPTNSARDVWEAKRAMSFPHGAPCTIALKKGARMAWENENRSEWLVLGYTLEERGRAQRFTATERNNLLPILIDRNVTRAMCFDLVEKQGIALPVAYKHGFANANCRGCSRATSPTYWNLTREVYPEVFEDRAAQSRRLGVRLVRVKGQRIFLDELKPTDTGRPLAAMPDCGLFCEEHEEAA